MRDNTRGKSGNYRRAAMAMIAIGIAGMPTVHANPPDNIILVPPTDLPELARQPGDTMFLHDTSDGRAILYVEQNQGAKLAIFDVTDPTRVESEGSVPLGARGPFDIVSPLGAKEELVRFRQDQGEAVLDLHKARLPSLMPLGSDSQGSMSLVGDNGFSVRDQSARGPVASDPQALQDYRVIDTSSSRSPALVVDVKDVHDELLKRDTGTTFLLTEAGLYLVRRPIAESEKKRREEDWFWQHTGG